MKKVVLSHVSGGVISSADDLTIDELDITDASTNFTLNPASGKTITVKKVTGTHSEVTVNGAGTVLFPGSWTGTVTTTHGSFKTK